VTRLAGCATGRRRPVTLAAVPAHVVRVLAAIELLLAIPTFVALRAVTAPYGRHARRGWGPSVGARLGWLVMESPAPLVFATVYLGGEQRSEAVPLVFLALWQAHYLHRAFLYPFLLPRGAARMPVAVVAMAIAFNVLNGYVNARWVSASGEYPPRWLVDPRFVVGAALFAGGLALNVTSDAALRRLRAAGDGGYALPRGGAFEWISCPNYLGEILEWAGWAVATWSLPGLAFAVYTAANLLPRALAHHAWYRARFPDYPPRRRALLPLLL
jgi:3-oxo-5-alpha-steroid 4-dehydrogenase 1